MREFLLVSCPIMLWVFAAAHVVFMAVLFPRYQKTRNVLFLLTGLIAFGLFYDALMLALGGVLSAGPVLMGLSRVRFVSHGALIPLLFPICAYALEFKAPWKKAVWALTALLMVAGIAEGFAVELVAKDAAGIVRYASGDNTPGWAEAVSSILSYGTVIPLIIAGVAAWVKQKAPFLFLSGFLMFLFSALGPATGNFDLIFYVSMYGEVLMILFLFLYARKRTA